MVDRSELVPIPESINGVIIEVDESEERLVHPSVIDGLQFLIIPDLNPTWELEMVYISCAYDVKGHKWPSRHAMGKAVDISRLNGHKMSVYYSSLGSECRILTQDLQARWENYENRRENFGPHMKKKLGMDWSNRIKGHRDHCHFSVN